jgi:acyl-CoA synthetase (NDP forming)
MDVVAEIISRDPDVDLVLYMGFNVVPQTEPEPGERDRNIARMALVHDMRRDAKLSIVPVGLTCLEQGSIAKRIYGDNGIWMLPGIEFGLTALGRAVRWNGARQTAASLARAVPVRPVPFAGALTEGLWFEAKGRRLLKSTGVPLVPATLATSESEAVAAAAAEQFGFPVVLKVCAAEIAHKSNIGGVKLNLCGPAEVRDAYAAITRVGIAMPTGDRRSMMVSVEDASLR